ncbi:MAG TPA: YetF domain-containing protein [Chryseosolibacter sp.]|nr:YetF domain-containing protein [Chryseosolibacter sp.]
MERYTLTSVLNLILLTASLSLFVYIRWYFSTLSSNIRNRLQTNEIFISMFVGFFAFFVISNKSIPAFNRYMFFLSLVAMFVGACVMYLRHLQSKQNQFPKAYVLFHSGKFYKGILIQHKLTEKDILSTLKMQGVNDLVDVDTIVLEANGELTVTLKEEVKTAA